MIIGSNPNPQPVTVTAFESPQFDVSMYPAQSISGQNFVLNIWQATMDTTGLQPTGLVQAVLYSTTAFIVTDPANGLFYFLLLSPIVGTTIPVGDYHYAIRRIDVGFEKRICYGSFSVLAEATE